MARIEFDQMQAMAATGGAKTLYQLGLIYSNGCGVEQDLVSAHKWFNLAALKGSEAAKEVREEIAADMTRDEIAKAQREARNWLQVH